MFCKNFQKFKLYIPKVFHVITAIILIGIGVFFSYLIIVQFYNLISVYIQKDLNSNAILEKSFLILLYAEVVSAIKIYFTNKYHFPLRFFFYIGITHLLRHIVISEGQSLDILFDTISIFILALGLSTLELKNYFLKKKEVSKSEDVEL